MPKSIKKDIREVLQTIKDDTKKEKDSSPKEKLTKEEQIASLTREVLKCAEQLEFEKAAKLRDDIEILKKM